MSTTGDTDAPGPGRTTTVRDEPVADRRRATDGPSTVRDRVRWGPVWAGLVVTLATYVLLQLALVGTGAYEASIGQVEGVNEGALLSGLIGLIAFFVGGIVAGASALWRDPVNGVLHGIITWGLALVALVVLAIFGGGFAAGAVGDAADQFDIDTEAIEEDFDADTAGDNAQEGSAIALLSLSLALAASAAGGAVGAAMWPTTREDLDLDLDLRDRDVHETRRREAAPPRQREVAGRGRP